MFKIVNNSMKIVKHTYIDWPNWTDKFSIIWLKVSNHMINRSFKYLILFDHLIGILHDFLPNKPIQTTWNCKTLAMKITAAVSWYNNQDML